MHIHGILLEKTDIEELTRLWGYGWVHIGYSCDAQTVNYCVKYITKVDNDHKGYKAKIFASKGLGKNYINTSNKRGSEYKKNNTNETYRLKNGFKTALPIYYRNNIYSEEERENLWLEKLDKNIRYIGKSKFNMNNEEERKQFYIKLDYEQLLS